MKTDVQQIRDKIFTFIKQREPGAIVDRSEIKEHLGMEAFAYDRTFEVALKTKKLEPVYERNEIGMGGKVIGYMRPHVIGFKLRSF